MCVFVCVCVVVATTRRRETGDSAGAGLGFHRKVMVNRGKVNNWVLAQISHIQVHKAVMPMQVGCVAF